MPVKSYLKQDPAMLPPVDERGEAADTRQGHSDLLYLSGFGHLHTWEAEGGPDKLWLARALYPEMTGDELRMWQRFLPTTCRKQDQYRFDMPPDEALQAVETATNLGCFDRVEVWTPEGNSFLDLVGRRVRAAQAFLASLADLTDPLAVGVLRDFDGTDRYFMIARWGEALLSPEEIRRHVRRVSTQGALLFGALPVLLWMLGVAACVQVIANVGLFWAEVLAIVVTLVSMVIASTILHKRPPQRRYV